MSNILSCKHGGVIRRFLPTDKLIILYKAFILPHLEYCGTLLLGIGKVQSDRLDNANYYILRTVLGYGKSVPYEQDRREPGSAPGIGGTAGPWMFLTIGSSGDLRQFFTHITVI